jgi:outer membrane protein assembly factor BamA
MRGLLTFIFFTLLCSSIYSQQLTIEFKQDRPIPKEIEIPKQTKDSLSLIGSLKRFVSDLRELGYLTASVDTIKISNNEAAVVLKIGDRYLWSQLERGNISDDALSRSNYSDKLYFNRPFNAKESSRFLYSLVQYYENNGYPFCQVSLRDQKINGAIISAKLNVTKGPLYLIDSILIKGDANIGAEYIYNYIGIRPGAPYSNKLINQVGDRLNEIPFLTQRKPYEIQFFEDKSKLILFLDKNNASRFDGIVGLLTDEETGKVEFTGNIELNLKNVIGKGESFDLEWRKLVGSTQNLDIHFNLPFLFKTPFGLDAKFELYKRDTLFLDIQNRIGLQYILKGYDNIQLYLQRNTSRRLGDGATTIVPSLPPYADYSSLLYGISYYKEKLNYRFNPKKGYQILGDLSVGNKTIEPISSLEEINPSAYDNIPLKSTLFNGRIDMSMFIPIGKRSTVKLRNQTAAVYNDALFENELLRIGGIKTLRGFDEESIFANVFTIGTLEYRFILERNSNIFLFADYGYYEQQLSTGKLSDNPLGLGAGINFQTGAGIFSINYAIGQQFNNPIDIRAAKIHFGFVNFF